MQQYDFLFSRSPVPTSLAIFRQLGFRYVSQCSRWIGVLDPQATLSLAVDGSDRAAGRARARRVPSPPVHGFTVGRQAPLGAESLANAVLSGSTTFDRTSAYFRWRYEQHPCFRYDFVWIGAVNAPDGLAVVRVEDVSGRPGRVLRVVEFLADSGHAVRLAKAVFAYGKEQGCAFADVFGMSERFVAGFVAAGGFHTLEEPELPLPHLFQPWSPHVDTSGLLFFGKRGKDADEVGCADDMSLLHVSRGDGNMDWPSWDPAGNCAIHVPAVHAEAA
jgi:hypothetical protein